ncbi:MAG: hypothetical protein M1819_000975 [Sarea resinae]|nr:MAG: hypothetical protein M1819_000975 [Sarea resinae]
MRDANNHLPAAQKHLSEGTSGPFYLQIVRPSTTAKDSIQMDAQQRDMATISNAFDQSARLLGAESIPRDANCRSSGGPPPLQHEVRNDLALGGDQNLSSNNPKKRAPNSHGSPEFPPIPSQCLLNSQDLAPLVGDKQSLDPPLHHGSALGIEGIAEAGKDCFNTIPRVPNGPFGRPEELPQPVPQTAGHLVAGPHSELASTVDMNNPYGHSPSRTFMNHVTEARRLRPPLEIHQDPQVAIQMTNDIPQSATEVATPTMAGTPNAGEISRTIGQVKAWIDALERQGIDKAQTGNHNSQQSSPRPDNSQNNDQSIASSIYRILPFLRSLISHVSEYPTLSSSLKSHAHRLDLLENASFCQGPVEELQERVDVFDEKLAAAESRIDDHETRLTVASEDSSGPRQASAKPKHFVHPAEAHSRSFSSNGSFATDISAHSSAVLLTRATDVLTNRFDTLQSKLEQLESSLPPSASRPWEVEVILIPWGERLKGIWYTADEPHQPNHLRTQDTEEWSQAYSMTSRNEPNRPFGATGHEWDAISQWADTADQERWAKAVGSKSRVHQRLRSRGFVKTVLIAGSSARDVKTAILEAFGDLLKTLNGGDNASVTYDGSQSSYKSQSSTSLGLTAPFVPLRKVHKASRLRFLGPDELVTPALWTVEFLSSSVFMRAAHGQKKLFITQRHAYMQHDIGKDVSWNWQRLRELPRFYQDDGTSEGQAESQVREADAREECWEWNSRLDIPPSAQSSFSSHHTSHSMLPLRHQPPPFESADSYHSITSSPHERLPISPLSEFPPDRPKQIPQASRTASMPINPGRSAAAPSISLPSKRRMASSFETGKSPSRPSNGKRSRITRSPTTLERQSERQLSPFFSEDVVPPETRSQGPSVVTAGGMHANVKRGSTPFAYATPHSTGPVRIERKDTGDDEGIDLEATDVGGVITADAAEDSNGEDLPWEGVRDDNRSDQSGDDDDESPSDESDEENARLMAPSIDEGLESQKSSQFRLPSPFMFIGDAKERKGPCNDGSDTGGEDACEEEEDDDDEDNDDHEDDEEDEEDKEDEKVEDDEDDDLEGNLCT